nr:MAG TPA: hypothetical protein [Caudoviricetes sp.]
MINVLKAIKTIKKIEQLQKELHTFSLAFSSSTRHWLNARN